MKIREICEETDPALAAFYKNRAAKAQQTILAKAKSASSSPAASGSKFDQILSRANPTKEPSKIPGLIKKGLKAAGEKAIKAAPVVGRSLVNLQKWAAQDVGKSYHR
jgi:hypothetical protein